MKEAARVTVKGAPKMTKKGRKKVAAWLRKQAQFIEAHDDLSENCTLKLFWV